MDAWTPRPSLEAKLSQSAAFRTMTIVKVSERSSAISAVFVPQLTFSATGPRCGAARADAGRQFRRLLFAITFLRRSSAAGRAMEAQIRERRGWLGLARQLLAQSEFGGPTRIRTWNQRIRVLRLFPGGADYLFTHNATAGVRDALACYQGHSSPQVVSAPSGGVPPARLRVAIGRTVKVSLNSSRSRSHLSMRRHLFDESSALTVEL